MIWQDKGFLLSINKYNENSSIAEFYTKSHGKVSGFIFGATSKKIKNYLLIGNIFHLNFTSNLDNKTGYFKAEIDKINTPIYLNNQKKLYCIVYTMNLIKLLTVENQQNIKIFNLIENFFQFLKDKDWLTKFIFFELKFYQNIGYAINFGDYVKNFNINGNQTFVVESSNKIIPNFLVDNNNTPQSNNEILSGYKIVGDFLEKTIIRPNNLKFPISRTEFVNLIK